MSSSVHPGETVDARVVLYERTETPVNAIRVTLRGHQRVAAHQPVVFETMSLAAEVARQIRLAPGWYEYRVRFALPEDAPLSFVGAVFSVWYTVVVHVDIPFWPDARDVFNIAVAARDRLRPSPRPRAQTTASGAGPFLELSLDDTVVAPGEFLTGAIAAGHVDPSSVRRIKLSLVAAERALSGRAEIERSRTHAVYVLAPGDVARGVPVRFKVVVPLHLTPAFQSPVAGLRWWFEARLERSLRSDLLTFVELDVGAFSFPRPETRGAPGPLLGTERWRRVWGEAAARHGLALDAEDLLLTGEIAGAEVRVSMGGDGQRFEVALDYPSLGIGLEVTRRRLPFGGIDIDDAAPAFAQRFRVRAREPAQARAALTNDLRRDLVAFSEARIDDVSVRAWLPGEDRDKVGAALDLVDALAQAIARARDRIPPPLSMAAALPAWSSFAESNRGKLFAGDMRVEAHLGGAPFEIATEFDHDAPARTRVAVRVDPPLPNAFDASDAAALGARARAAPVLARELSSIGALKIEEEKITLLLPRPLADPEEHAPTVASLLRLASLLRGDAGAGPYR